MKLSGVQLHFASLNHWQSEHISLWRNPLTFLQPLKCIPFFGILEIEESYWCRGAAHKLKPILFPTPTSLMLDVASLLILTSPTFLSYSRAYIIPVLDLGLNTLSRVCSHGCVYTYIGANYIVCLSHVLHTLKWSSFLYVDIIVVTYVSLVVSLYRYIYDTLVVFSTRWVSLYRFQHSWPCQSVWRLSCS